MSIYFISKGDCYLGENPHFESNDDGSCVAVGEISEGINEFVSSTVSVYGDYQASKYLGKMLEFINPERKPDIPDFKSIVKRMYDDNVNICDYCYDCNCDCCIVEEWKEGDSS